MTRHLLVLAVAVTLFGAAERSVGQEPPPISGVYEILIGTDDLISQIQYWQRFGFRVGVSGTLAGDETNALYGVDSGVRSLRLEHQDSDHGLLRLMLWDQPLGEGLGTAPMKVQGGRWGAMLTSDVYRVVNHVEDSIEQGHPIVYVEPQRQVIYADGKERRPFLDEVIGVREMVLIRPQTRQILFQRYGYTIPLYGKVNRDAPFPTSQVTHAGLVLVGGSELTDFYDAVLGLLRARDGSVSDVSDVASRNVFDMAVGESYTTTDFDDPRSDPKDLSRTRSGRLKLVRFPAGTQMPDLRSVSRPGHLGYSAYSYRVGDLDGYHRRVESSRATSVSAIRTNEFGERSFSFKAPDGNWFVLVEW